MERLCWRAQVYAWLGVEPPRGVLLHGPPGCGKTALAHAIAYETGVPFLRVSAPEIVAGVSGAHSTQEKLPSLPSCAGTFWHGEHILVDTCLAFHSHNPLWDCELG